MYLVGAESHSALLTPQHLVLPRKQWQALGEQWAVVPVGSQIPADQPNPVNMSTALCSQLSQRGSFPCGAQGAMAANSSLLGNTCSHCLDG